MEIQPPRFDVWIEADEQAQVRAALRDLVDSRHRAEAFSGAALHELLGAWEQFVTTDWTRWDTAEYSNDIGVRQTLEVVRGSLGDASRRRLDVALAPLDQLFKSRMRPIGGRDGGALDLPFWVAHTIWNTPPG